MIKVFQFDCFPGRTLTLALTKPSKDLGAIKDIVLAQNLAVINASLILDQFVVLTAANRCLINQKNGTMKTRSLNGELLFGLSASMHVTESLATFGLNPGLAYVIFAAFDLDTDTFKQKLLSVVSEEEVLDLSEIPKHADLEAIRKVYKIQSSEDPLEDILSIIATKGI